MQLHQIKPIHKNKEPKRIGRGGKKGATSGKGTKGQSSRAGRRFQPLFRQIIQRYPKLRGSRSRTIPKNMVAVNLDKIGKSFKSGEIVSPKSLLEKRAISFPGKKIPKVKVLGRGELTKVLTFEDCLFSRSAKEKVEKAGGVIKIKDKK